MFRLDQKGISLPLVLAILGLVIANTYYFMDVEKSTKDQNIKRGAEIEDNSEKVRLASFLSDVNVCSSINEAPVTGNEVFGGKTLATINTLPAPGTPAVPLKKRGVNFLETAIQTGPNENPNFQPLYGRGSLKLLYYQIVVTNPAAELSKRYSLQVTYSIINRANQLLPTGKTKVIRLPIYIVFTGGTSAGVIKTCFTEADNDLNTVTSAVTGACQGDTALLNGLECQHEQIDKTCPVNEVFTGVKVSDPLAGPVATNKIEYKCGRPLNAGSIPPIMDCPTTPVRHLLGSVQDGDKFFCQTTDPTGCTNSQMFVMGATEPKCVQHCAANALLNSIDSTGYSNCFPRPDPCPPGEYAQQISAGGKVSCKQYTLVNKLCSPGMAARNINPTPNPTGSGDTVLGCLPVTIGKKCAEPTTEATFVQSFTVATSLSCHTY